MSDTTVALGHWKGLWARAVALIKQPLFANAGYLLGVSLVAGATGFAFWGLAARLYRPEEVGVASAMLSAMSFVSGLANLGLGFGLVRFLPETKFPNRLLNTAFTFVALATLVIAGGYLAGITLWSPSLWALRENGLYTAGFLACTVAMALGMITQSAFTAYRRASYAFIQACVVSVGRLLLAVVLAGLGPIGLASSVGLSLFVAVTLCLAVFFPRIRPGYCPRPDFLWTELLAMIPYSVGSHMAALLAQTPQMILPLVVLEVLGAAPSGYAYIAWMLGSLLASPGVALANSAFAEAANAPRSMSAVLAKAAALGLGLTIPVAITVGGVAPWLLLLFGPSYAREASGLLRWLAVASPLGVIAGLYFTYLRVQKRIGQLALLSSLVAAITLGTAVVLMPRSGISASGAGWLLGNSLVVIVAAANIKREISGDQVMVKSLVQIRPFERQDLSPLVVAAIPCYNEGRFVGGVVRRALDYADIVVVVDDGSSDDTVEQARAAGAKVVEHGENMGPGAAARSCLQVGRELNADVLVTLDGDGQHDPSEIPEIAAPALKGEADVVIGSRFMGRYNNVAFYRRFGINVITFLYNFGARPQITDGQSCFRAYNRRALETLRITESGFGFSVETLVQARRIGLRIVETSISCVYHEECHSMNPVIHGVGVALMVLKHRILGAFAKLGRNAASVPDPAR